MTKPHKLNGLKQQKFMLSPSGGQKSEPHRRCWLSCIPSEDLRAESSLASSSSRGPPVALGLWPHPSNLSATFPRPSPLCVSVSKSPFLTKLPVVGFGPLSCLHFNLITTVKNRFPNKITIDKVLGVRVLGDLIQPLTVWKGMQ